MVRYFIFDLGNVIVDYTNKRYYDYLSGISGVKRSDVDYLVDPLVAKLEIGIITLEKFQNQVGNSLGIRPRQVKWLEYYKKTVKINNSVLGIVEDLHKKYKTAFLSNIDRSRYDFTMNNILDTSMFDHKYASCFLNIRKPDTEVFRYVAWQLGAKPADIVFVDDRPENVYSSCIVGMHGIRFVGAGKLHRELKRYLE